MKLVGLGVGRTGHAAELVVQAEVILEGNRRQSLVFGLNGHAFFGLYRLVQAIAPAAACHQATGEFVHDDNFTVLHHIVLVTVEQVVRPQGGIHVVHEGNVARVVQARAFGQQAGLTQNALSVFVTLLGQKHLVAFFINREVARGDHTLASAGVFFAFLPFEIGHHLVDGDVHGGVVFRLPADDQWRAGLVNQDRVHLVHNGKVLATLHAVCGFVHHVVAQVVKSKFVVGAVGDVGLIGGLLVFSGSVGQIHAYS